MDPSTQAAVASAWVAGISAVAAIGSAGAALALLKISLRTASATDKAADAQHASASATDALRQIEVERGHADLAPRVQFEWVCIAPKKLAIEVRNESWRGYRATAIHVISNGKQQVSMSDTLLSRGTARFWPVALHDSMTPEDVQTRVERAVSDATIEIEWSTDDLWRCPCSRPHDSHWVEHRQLPPPPATTDWYGSANATVATPSRRAPASR